MATIVARGSERVNETSLNGMGILAHNNVLPSILLLIIFLSMRLPSR